MESPDVAVYAPTHPCICARRPCLREFTVKSAVVNVPWSAAHHTGQLHNMLTFSATCAFDTPLQRNVRLLSTLHLFPLRSVTRMATVVAAAATVSALVNLVSVTRTWMKIASFLSFVTACHAQNVTRELQLCMACSTPCCVHDRSHPPATVLHAAFTIAHIHHTSPESCNCAWHAVLHAAFTIAHIHHTSPESCNCTPCCVHDRSHPPPRLHLPPRALTVLPLTRTCAALFVGHAAAHVSARDIC
jgi:hypothetical protein